MTTGVLASDPCDRIDAITANQSLLQHPFYQRWQAGELIQDELKRYACRYNNHVLGSPEAS